MDAEQLKGLASNIKGIFHELKYVENFNTLDNGFYAEVYKDTNHAGGDVLIKDIRTNEVINEVQLKSTDSLSYVTEHTSKYPDIDVLATSEVANKMEGVGSSGFSNEEITNTVKKQFENISDLSTVEQLGDAVVISGLLSAALKTSDVMSGKKDFDKVSKEVFVDVAIATSTTALVSLLF
jgi:hypothetical protein